MNELFKKRYFFFDYARGRTLIKSETRLLFDTIKRAGYNGICLHLEGFFETNAYPGIVREGYLKIEEAKWISDIAKEYGMDLIPVVNLIAHIEPFGYYQERFADMRKAGSKGQFDLFDPRLEIFAHTIIDELLDIYNPKYLHIGGDETALNDEEKKKYVEFLSQLCDYIAQKGVNPCVWGDMILSSADMLENFTKDVTIFDWYYYGHSKGTLECFLKHGFKEIFACPCDQGWDGFIGTQHLIPWGEWPKLDAEPIEFNEVEAFLSDAHGLGIKNAVLTDWENTNGHNLWSQMDAVARAGLYMSGKEISRDNIENVLFGKNTPHSEITYLLQNVQNEMYIPILDNKSSQALKCRMSDAFYSESHFISWLNLASVILDRAKKCESDLDKAEKLLNEWQTETETEEICKASLFSTLHYAKALYALAKLGDSGYAEYHKAAMVQFESPENAVVHLENAIEYLSVLIEEAKAYKAAQEKYLDLCGQTKIDTIRLNAFCDSMSSLREKMSDFSKHITELRDDIKNMRVLPSWQMLVSNIDKFELMV